MKPDLAKMSDEVFSLDVSEKRILKYLALYGPMNLSELSQHTTKYAYSLDRWSLKKHLQGSSRFMGLIPYEYIAPDPQNKKEIKYNLTTKGILACLSIVPIKKNNSYQQYVKKLAEKLPHEGIKSFIEGFIIQSIQFFIYWHYLSGINLTKLKSSQYYILNFFNRTTNLNEINLTEIQLKENYLIKNTIKKFITYVTSLDLITEGMHFPHSSGLSLVHRKKIKKKIVKNTKTYLFGTELWYWPYNIGETNYNELNQNIDYGRLCEMFFTKEIIDDVNLELKQIGMNFKWENKLKDPFGLEDKDDWIKIFLED